MSVQAMSWVFQHSHARLGARLVLLAIANHADAHGRNSWASVAVLSEESHLSERETRYALRDLETAGEVVRVATSPRRTHVYELPGMSTLWEGADIAPIEGAESAGAKFAGGKVPHLRGQSTAVEGAIPAPEPSRTTQNRQKVSIIFAAFWEIYPRRVGKPKARAAYERAIKRAAPDVILAGAKAYRDDPNRDAEFTAHPTTWLNRDGWEDEPIPDRTLPNETRQRTSRAEVEEAMREAGLR